MNNFRGKTVAYLLLTSFLITFYGFSVITEASVQNPFDATKTAYKTIPALLALCWFFSAYAWKWRIFKNWLVPFPNLEGTWQGSIQTTWEDPVTKKIPTSIPAILTIKQSYARITCVMRTSEMTSRSYMSGLWIDDDQQVKKLGYSYNSIPLIDLRDRSQPHEGTVELEIIGDPVDRLCGVYWTARKTTGTVTLTFRCKELLTEYPEDMGEHPMQRV